MYKIATFSLLFAFSCLYFSCITISESTSEKTGMRDALAQEIEMTMDKATGKVPKYKLLAAKKAKDASLKTRAAIAGVDWTELGPNNCAGRSRCAWVDLNDASGNTVWTAGVGGGLWKTNNITASVPVWNKINDLFDNIAITDIAQDPTNTNIMYFCTGEGYGVSDRIQGIGIFKSTNGGNTWAPLANTNGFNTCLKIIVTNTGTILLSTGNAGLQRSTNGGATFTKVLGTGLGITGANSDVNHDVERASNGDVYATIAGSVHKSTNDGGTFGAALPIGVTAFRIEIATAASNANELYLCVESGGQITNILFSANGGTSWVAKSLPVDADGGVSPDISRGQAWYDISIAVDPNNSQNLFVGGIDLFKSSNGGTSWNQVSHWFGGFGFQDVHADQHDAFFASGSSSKAFFTNDGGIYYTADANAVIPNIISKEIGFNTAQFYSGAIHPTAANYYFLGGTQDNGSHALSAPTVSNSIEITGGDGGFCHIDQDQPQYQFTSGIYNRFYRSADGGASFNTVNHGSSGRFINPSDYDDINNKMYSARSGGEYLLWDNPQTGNTFITKTIAGFNGQTVSSVKVSATTANRVFFGFGNGTIIRVDNANATAPVATTITNNLPSMYISCIELEAGNDNHIIVTSSSYGANSIWETTNGGTAWTSIEGNLPDMPVRWALFNPTNADQLLIATELGVWSTDNINAAATVWGASNTGLANTRVDMLQTRISDKLVLASTHGRGMFLSDIFADPTANFSANTQIGYVGKAIQFKNNSFQSTAYNWSFGDATNATIENPSKIYNAPGFYTVSLSINNGVSVKTKNAYIQILPNVATPYIPAQGGDFETNAADFGAFAENGTNFVRGISTTPGKDGSVSGNNVWVTGLAGNYENMTTSYLYTPNFDFSFTGNYTLSFSTKYQVETDYDGYVLQYSTDSGTTWENLGSNTQANWYNFSNNPAISSVFPFAQAFFSDNTGGQFIPKSYDVSFLQTNPNVAFRFAFKSDPFSVDPGVAIDDFAIDAPSAPLNLTTLQLQVNPINATDAHVQWNTTFETGIDYFEVQRSMDGINYTAIEKINAKQNLQNDYQITDKNPWLINSSEIIYYRIKSVFKNASATLSESKFIKNTDLNLIAVSPIPCYKFIDIQSMQAIKKVKIISLEGKQIMQISDCKGQIVFPENIADGTYMVIIETKNGSVQRKIIKKS